MAFGSYAFTLAPDSIIDLIKLIEGACLISSVPGLNDKPHIAIFNPDKFLLKYLYNLENKIFF